MVIEGVGEMAWYYDRWDDGSAGSIEEACKYCVEQLSCWLDADGACEWIAEHLEVHRIPHRIPHRMPHRISHRPECEFSIQAFEPTLSMPELEELDEDDEGDLVLYIPNSPGHSFQHYSLSITHMPKRRGQPVC